MIFYRDVQESVDCWSRPIRTVSQCGRTSTEL